MPIIALHKRKFSLNVFLLKITISALLDWFQSSGSVVDDRLSLDVHAISELQDKGFKPTDDLPKYSYTANDNGYGMCLRWIRDKQIHTLLLI